MNAQNKKNFWILCASQLLTLSGFFSIFQFPLYIQHLGGGKQEIGILMGAMTIASAGFAPWITQAVSKFERRRMMYFGAFLLSISTYGLFLVGKINLILLVLMMLRGLGFALFINASGAYLAEIIPSHQRARFIGMNFGFNQVAIGLGPLLAEQLIVHYHFQAYLSVAALFPLGGVVLLKWLVPRHPLQPSHLHWLNDAIYFGKALHNVRLRRSFGCLFLVASGLGGIFSFIAPYAKFLQVSSGVFFTFYAVFTAVCRFWGAGLADRYPRPMVAALCFGIMACGTLGLSFSSTLWDMAICAVVIGIGFGIANPAVLALMLDRSTADQQSLAIGVFHFAFQLGNLLGTPLLGQAAKYWNYEGMWPFAAGILAIAALLILFSRPLPVDETKKIHGATI